MKNLKTMIVLSVVFLTALSIISCQKTQQVANHEEYQAGFMAGKKMSENDAAKSNCRFRSTEVNANLNNLLGNHIIELEPEHSQDYMTGFRRGYRYSFQEYYRRHCPKY